MTYVGLYFCSLASIQLSTNLYSLIVERSSQGIYPEAINIVYDLKSHRTAQMRNVMISPVFEPRFKNR